MDEMLLDPMILDSAYAQGRGARRNNLPVTACPYDAKAKPLLSFFWRNGWADVNETLSNSTHVA